MGFALTATTDSGVQSLLNSDAMGIAATGMLIVFTALTLLSLFIAMLPRILGVFAERLPETEGIHGQTATGGHLQAESDNDEVLAAIGFVLRMRHLDQRKIE